MLCVHCFSSCAPGTACWLPFRSAEADAYRNVPLVLQIPKARHVSAALSLVHVRRLGQFYVRALWAKDTGQDRIEGTPGVERKERSFNGDEE